MRKLFLPGFLGLSVLALSGPGTAQACVSNGRLFSPPTAATVQPDYLKHVLTLEVTGRVEPVTRKRDPRWNNDHLPAWQIISGDRTFQLELSRLPVSPIPMIFTMQFTKLYSGKTVRIVGRLETRTFFLHPRSGPWGTPDIADRRVNLQVLVVDRMEVIETEAVRVLAVSCSGGKLMEITGRLSSAASTSSEPRISALGTSYQLEFANPTLQDLANKLDGKVVRLTGHFQIRTMLINKAAGTVTFLPVSKYQQVVVVTILQVVEMESVRQTETVEARGRLLQQGNLVVDINGAQYLLNFGINAGLRQRAQMLTGQKVLITGRLLTDILQGCGKMGPLIHGTILVTDIRAIKLWTSASIGICEICVICG